MAVADICCRATPGCVTAKPQFPSMHQKSSPWGREKSPAWRGWGDGETLPALPAGRGRWEHGQGGQPWLQPRSGFPRAAGASGYPTPLGSSRNPVKLKKSSFLILDLKRAHRGAVDGAVPPAVPLWEGGASLPGQQRELLGARFKQALFSLEASPPGVLLGCWFSGIALITMTCCALKAVRDTMTVIRLEVK